MKKVFFVLIFMSLAIAGVFAQDNSDPKAEAILNEMRAKYSAITDLSGKFTYGIVNVSNRQLSKDGTFKLKKGNKFAIQLDGQEIYIDGKKQYVYLPDDNEVSIYLYDDAEGINLDQLFKLYENNSKAYYLDNESVHGQVCDKIRLLFTDKSLEYNQAIVWVNQKTSLLEKVVTIDRRQTRTNYEFFELKVDKGFSDDDFRFNIDAHQGVDVYDETR